jgi:hypothetical protein
MPVMGVRAPACVDVICRHGFDEEKPRVRRMAAHEAINLIEKDVNNARK